MDRVNRVGGRLPRFYKSWEKNSLIFNFIRGVTKELDETEVKITDLMKAHWVDTAIGDELNSIGVLLGVTRTPEESDLIYRDRLKRAVIEYEGGGTVTTIIESVKAIVKSEGKEDARIVENPPVSAFAEFTVRAGDTWTLGSNSIEDTQPCLTVIVEEEGLVSEPKITNVDTGESITYQGEMKTGEKLVCKNQKASLDKKDVTQKLSSKEIPKLLRKGSTWQYNESIEKLVAVFDTAKFDEHMFAVKVPSVKIRFDWTRLQPATFEIQVNSKVLSNSGYFVHYLENVVNSLKAAGIKEIITVTG